MIIYKFKKYDKHKYKDDRFKYKEDRLKFKTGTFSTFYEKLFKFISTSSPNGCLECYENSIRNQNKKTGFSYYTLVYMHGNIKRMKRKV